jgi:hypothetical protein
VNDSDFDANTVIVDEASDQRTSGKVGECKNDSAYRTVLLADAEGRKAMKSLKQFLAGCGKIVLELAISWSV